MHDHLNVHILYRPPQVFANNNRGQAFQAPPLSTLRMLLVTEQWAIFMDKYNLH